MYENIILNDFLKKLKTEKELILNKLQKIDFKSINREEIDEELIYPFRSKYIFTVPSDIVGDVYLSGKCVCECIDAYLEIEKTLNDLSKSS